MLKGSIGLLISDSDMDPNEFSADNRGNLFTDRTTLDKEINDKIDTPNYGNGSMDFDDIA